MPQQNNYNREDHPIDKEKIEELAMKTWLSEREAELYLLYRETENNLGQAAEKMGIEENTVYSYWRNVKDKVRKSKDTVELNVKT